MISNLNIKKNDLDDDLDAELKELENSIDEKPEEITNESIYNKVIERINLITQLTPFQTYFEKVKDALN